MALALHQQGRASEAARNRAACGPPALLTEEFDVAQRQLRYPGVAAHLLSCDPCNDDYTGLLTAVAGG